MSKRYTETTIWDEDWFIDIPKDYKLFWYFLKDACDHAGIWKPNVSRFNKLNECKVDLSEAIGLFNSNKDRVKVLTNGRWLIIGFCPFQYGPQINTNNRVHESVLKIFEANDVDIDQCWPQFEENGNYQEKDKETEANNIANFDLIKISNEDYKKLCDSYGKEKTEEYCQRLNDYIGSKGDKYKSHSHTIILWMRRDGLKPKKENSLLPPKKDCKMCFDPVRNEASGWIYSREKGKNIPCPCRGKENK